MSDQSTIFFTWIWNWKEVIYIFEIDQTRMRASIESWIGAADTLGDVWRCSSSSSFLSFCLFFFSFFFGGGGGGRLLYQTIYKYTLTTVGSQILTISHLKKVILGKQNLLLGMPQNVLLKTQLSLGKNSPSLPLGCLITPLTHFDIKP